MNTLKDYKIAKVFAGIFLFLVGSIVTSLLALIAVLVWAGIWTVLGGAF